MPQTVPHSNELLSVRPNTPHQPELPQPPLGPRHQLPIRAILGSLLQKIRLAKNTIIPGAPRGSKKVIVFGFFQSPPPRRGDTLLPQTVINCIVCFVGGGSDLRYERSTGSILFAR